MSGGSPELNRSASKGGLFGSIFGGKGRKGQEAVSFSSSASTNEQILREAVKAESLTAANLRTELNSLQGEYKLQAKLLEKELRHVKLLTKENETLKNLLQKGPEGQKAVFAENEALKAEVQRQNEEIIMLNQKLALAEGKLVERTNEWNDEREKLKVKVKTLLQERNAFEQKCATLQSNRLKQNFSEKSMADIVEESRTIFHRSLELVACHKDLPRLCRNMNFIDMEGNVIARGQAGVPPEHMIKELLVKLAAKVDGAATAQRLDEIYFRDYVDPDGKRDLIKALGKLLVEGLGEENKTCLLLKAANQSVVAPVIGYLHNGLQGVLPFNSAKGGWRIQILLGSQNIRVTHMRKEEANQESEDLYGPFSFDWNIDFVLDTDVTTLKEMEVSLVSVNAIDEKKETSIREILQKSFDLFKPASQKAPVIHIPVAKDSRPEERSSPHKNDDKKEKAHEKDDKTAEKKLDERRKEKDHEDSNSAITRSDKDKDRDREKDRKAQRAERRLSLAPTPTVKTVQMEPSNDDPFGIGGIGTVNKGAVSKKARESMYASGKG